MKNHKLFLGISILSMMIGTSFSHANTVQPTTTLQKQKQTKNKEKALEQTLKTKIPKNHISPISDISTNAQTTPTKNINTRKTTNPTKNITTATSPIATNAKRSFADKILNSWNIPVSATDQSVSAKVSLDDKGQVKNIETQAHDPNVKASLEKAIQSAAPFSMPKDPVANKESQQFNLNVDLK